MPPLVPRKRLMRTPSPDTHGRVAKQSGRGKAKVNTAVKVPHRKTTLFEDLDSASKKGSAEKTRAAIQQMQDDDDSSSLSSLSDAEFEDVPAAKRVKTDHGSEDSNDDEEMEFEDVPSHQQQQEQPEPELGDLELTLYQDNRPVPLPSELGKKGPSKREKAIRISTHCMHVQFLMWHNAVRNSWLCDEEVQAILISHLPPRLWEEFDRWKRSSGLNVAEASPKKEVKEKKTAKGRGKRASARPTKDWSDAAERLEKGVPDLSHGDPLFRLMKALVSWWKQRFRTTSPGLRKWGYMNARRLGKLRAAFEEKEHDPNRFGERIENIDDFRRMAQNCTGSRDVGAQLFTALLRGLGLEARMVANIQSLGFGWSRAEEADDEKPLSNGKKADEPTPRKEATVKKKTAPIKPTRRKARKNDKDALTMDLDDSDEYAEPLEDESEDNLSVVSGTQDVRTRKPESTTSYDKELEFPIYWSEILSPVTSKYLSVDPIVKSVVGTNRDLVESLEPRGGKADKAKQIMAYTVGFSPDGTAKDVTVRYLRKQIFPGKTKGTRMPEEKVPIYNKHGKVKKYDQFDWFKSVMRGYGRGSSKHPVVEADEIEESTDLKPALPEKKEVKEGEETLQYYKSSKEFVLQRHLKREEALLPSAVPIKIFRNKVKGGKVEEEDVYLRKDVVAVKSAETWHKVGRAPLQDAEPRKHAPYRAATTNRRREIAEAEAATGKKVLQPLYSEDQTDWIIPDPIENGVIPKNEYGNIDMFAEHMCPEGAIHVPFRYAVRVCKRLQIDYAEAVVGFEFGHRMAVPVIKGVVIAQEHYDNVIVQLEKDEAERARKEDEKRRKASLGSWRKFLMGLRIAERIRRDHGHIEESVEVFGHVGQGDPDGAASADDGEDMAGGFLPEGYEGEESTEMKANPTQTSAYFSAPDPYDENDEGDDPFQVEYSGHPAIQESEQSELTSVSDLEPEPDLESEPKVVLRKAPKKAAPKPKPKPRQSTRRRTRKTLVESSEGEDDEDEDFMLSDSDD
ncbi:Rad4-domain-containing protein [Xylariaceae sp. FL1019]|nr:Rad4-domain-containing protein [Xylariaceae sp. FL1019]